jgi:hypothetical protein
MNWLVCYPRVRLMVDVQVSMIATSLVDGGCTGEYDIHECGRWWMHWFVCEPRVQ